MLENPYFSAVLISVFRLVGSILGLVLIRHACGKRPLLVATSLLMGLAILMLGVMAQNQMFFIYTVGLSEFWVETALPVLCLVLFMVSFGMGPATVPWTLQGELVPPTVSSYYIFY